MLVGLSGGHGEGGGGVGRGELILVFFPFWGIERLGCFPCASTGDEGSVRDHHALCGDTRALRGGSRLYEPRVSIHLYPPPVPPQRGHPGQARSAVKRRRRTRRRRAVEGEGTAFTRRCPCSPGAGLWGRWRGGGGEAGKEAGGGLRCSAPPSLAAPLAPGRGAGRERLPRTAAAAAGTGHVPRGCPLPARPLGSLSWRRPVLLFIFHFIYSPLPHTSPLLLLLLLLFTALIIFVCLFISTLFLFSFPH